MSLIHCNWMHSSLSLVCVYFTPLVSLCYDLFFYDDNDTFFSSLFHSTLVYCTLVYLHLCICTSVHLCSHVFSSCTRQNGSFKNKTKTTRQLNDTVSVFFFSLLVYTGFTWPNGLLLPLTRFNCALCVFLFFFSSPSLAFTFTFIVSLLLTLFFTHLLSRFLSKDVCVMWSVFVNMSPHGSDCECQFHWGHKDDVK